MAEDRDGFGEPWVQGRENPRLVFDRDDRIVVVCAGARQAARVVAAVNAVSGIPDEVLATLETGVGFLWRPDE